MITRLLRVALVAAGLLLSFPNEVVGQQPTPPQGPPVMFVAPDSLNADTLHVAPWIAYQMAQFDSLDGPRVFCVTAFHQWEHFTYLKSLRPNEAVLRCIGSEPVFVQSIQCPPGEISPQGGSPVFILLQCGDEDNIRYYVPRKAQFPRGN